MLSQNCFHMAQKLHLFCKRQYPLRWVNRLLSNNNDMKSQARPCRRIGVSHFHWSQAWRRSRFIISIADKPTKVVKEVTLTPMRLRGLAWLLTLSIWIQITIHPLSTDGSIVIQVFLNRSKVKVASVNQNYTY